MSDGFGEAVETWDAFGPLTGHRFWHVNNDGMLTGFFGVVVWPVPPASLMAEHIHLHHGPDFVECAECPSPPNATHFGWGCGIYGFASSELLARHGSCFVLANQRVVWGTCEMGGTVWEHQGGYRAQAARVTGIYDCEFGRGSEGIPAEVADRYGVPLLSFPHPGILNDRRRSRRALPPPPPAPTKTMGLRDLVEGAGSGSNNDKEAIWFSPHCLGHQQESLFLA